MSATSIHWFPLAVWLSLSLFISQPLSAQPPQDDTPPNQEETKPRPIECDFVVYNTVYPEATCIYAPDAATAVKIYEEVHLVRFANSLGYFCDFSNCSEGEKCELYFFGWHPGHNWHPEPMLDSLIPNKWHFPKIYRHTGFACNKCTARFHGTDPVEGHTHGDDQDAYFLEARLSLSPNPANSWLQVNLDLSKVVDDGILYIQDINGQILLERNYSNLSKGVHQRQLDISALPPGTYYMSLISDRQRAVVSSFVIQR